MTACDVVEIVSAAALGVVLAAYRKAIWRLPRVGPWLFTAALLTSLSVMADHVLGSPLPREICSRLLLVGAQTSAVVALWLALHHAPSGPLRAHLGEAGDE